MLHMSWVLQALLRYWWYPLLTALDSPVQGVPYSRNSPTGMLFLCRSPSWEYTDIFHMYVFLPSDGKCSHGRSPQTHFCLCLMDGYDRSSFFIAVRIAALVIGSHIRHHLPAFRVQWYSAPDVHRMCFVQDADNFLFLYTPDDLHFFLELAFCIPSVKLRFDPQLVQHTFIKPAWRQFGIREIQKNPALSMALWKVSSTMDSSWLS